jgi:hypothetical protein
MIRQYENIDILNIKDMDWLRNKTFKIKEEGNYLCNWVNDLKKSFLKNVFVALCKWGISIFRIHDPF